MTFTADAADEIADVNRLRGSAMAGSLDAKLALVHRLIGAPQSGNDLIEGAAVTVSAANDGNGEAAYLTAILSASAVGMRRNWANALVYLQRAAELGFSPAREEFLALSGDRALAQQARGQDGAPDVWEKLRRGIDLKRLLASPRPKTLAVRPRLALVENFASAQLCDHLIARAQGRLVPLPAGDGRETDAAAVGGTRLSVTDLSLATILLLDRIAELAGTTHRGFETPAVLRFSGNVPFPPHADTLDPADPEAREELVMEGQRFVTCQIFLNDDYEGGETEFPALEKGYKGRKGDALLWWNLDTAGRIDPSAVNGNAAVTEGEKWILSQWIRIPAVQR
jgi:prolyl 4-hydroxylase